jgi:hypothetical protein
VLRVPGPATAARIGQEKAALGSRSASCARFDQTTSVLVGMERKVWELLGHKQVQGQVATVVLTSMT